MVTRTSSERPALTRDRCTAAAVALADAEGLRSVTMRRLAAELGVEAMSLYHHVRNKDDLLDAMVDAVFAEIELPPHDAADWTVAMRDRAASLRRVLLAHPWAITLMESRSHPGPHLLRHHDAVIGCCRRFGLSVEMTAHAFSLIDSYVYGFVLQEIHLPFSEGDDLDATIAEMMPPDFAEQYPHFAELAAQHVTRPGYEYADEFEFGIGAVLAAVRPRRRGRR